MNAPKLTINEIEFYERDVQLRLPFKFGVVTLTEAPQAFIRARIRTEDGREGWGQAAELMVPKWFDKTPDLSNQDNFNQLRLALYNTREAYIDRDPMTAFGLLERHYHELIETGSAANLNPLTVSFGPALVDRAVLDALSRTLGVSFYEAVGKNICGLRSDILAPDLSGFDMDGFLAGLTPMNSIHARHTVGMLDPLTASDQAPEDRVGDGLPETLEEIIDTYGHRYFKIKVRGDLEADIDRLSAIAAVLDRTDEPYMLSLDGNEQYDDAEGVRELWQDMEATPVLKRFCRSVLFIEQPIKRAAALDRDMSAVSEIRPVIIDESDGDFATYLQARDKGYRGVSSKSCKGFYKALLNAARSARWNAEAGAGSYFMSGEDLTCQSGISVQQDLALVSLLGLGHVERNGHHYVNGMAGASNDEQQAFLSAHPGLYRQRGGRVCLDITNGQINIGSLACPGYAVGTKPDWSAMQPMQLPKAA